MRQDLHPFALSSAELQHLSPEEVLAVCLWSQEMLATLRAQLYQVQMPLSTRAVAMYLVLSQVPQLDLQGEVAPTTFDVKAASERLGLTPAEVRAAYEQLAHLGAVTITGKTPPRRRAKQQS